MYISLYHCAKIHDSPLLVLIILTVYSSRRAGISPVDQWISGVVVKTCGDDDTFPIVTLLQFHYDCVISNALSLTTPLQRERTCKETNTTGPAG